MEKEIAIASDHAGFLMKENIKSFFNGEGMIFEDFGTHSEMSVDYPDFIHPLAEALNEGKYKAGIVLCGSGNGVAMVANKYPFVRAAVCWNEEITKLSRKHNNANIIAIPTRFVSAEEAIRFVKIFLDTEFEGGRHEERVRKINPTQTR